MILKILLGGIIAVVLLVLVCNYIVVWSTSDAVHDNVDDIKHETWGMLLGTPPKSRYTGRVNYFYKYRIEAVAKLYKAGKIDSVLVSGDEHSLDGINEAIAMRNSLVARGVPIGIIKLDGKGFRTQASIDNTVNKFGIKSFIIISQKFHNERAVYLARHMKGVEVERVQGYNARSPHGKLSMITYAREYLARVKLFLDLLLQ
ncbi:MAG: YdcF family protein [Muribaculaceae bacterium]|nr:YdcF family protein [Muribaculaceae bacterium]